MAIVNTGVVLHHYLARVVGHSGEESSLNRLVVKKVHGASGVVRRHDARGRQRCRVDAEQFISIFSRRPSRRHSRKCTTPSRRKRTSTACVASRRDRLLSGERIIARRLTTRGRFSPEMTCLVVVPGGECSRPATYEYLVHVPLHHVLTMTDIYEYK